MVASAKDQSQITGQEKQSSSTGQKINQTEFMQRLELLHSELDDLK